MRRERVVHVVDAFGEDLEQLEDLGADLGMGEEPRDPVGCPCRPDPDGP
jgi:hypothetical protein